MASLAWLAVMAVSGLYATPVAGKEGRSAHACKWTAPDGTLFDLTELTRKVGDGDW